MPHTLTRGEKGKVEIKVDIAKADFDKTYTDVLQKLGAETKVDGFRPGNVPVDVLESKIGLNKILNEVASHLVSTTLADVFKKEDIVPIINPKIAINSLVKGQPFSFNAEVIARPKAAVGNWKTIKANKIKAKDVTEEDINASIKNIFEAWKKSSSAKASEGQAQENAEESTGKFIYDAHGGKIPLKDDKPKGEPKIDDEFAKAIGARDLLHLQELVKKDLESIVTDQSEQKYEEEIFEEILKVGDVEVPDILVDDEVNRMMIRLNQNLEQMGRKMDDFLQEENTTVDAMRAKWREQAERNVKVTLILDEIGQEAKITVTKEDIDDAAKGLNQENMTGEQKLDLEKYLAVSIFQSKTLAYVKKTISAS